MINIKTVYDLKHAYNLAQGGHCFDRATMRFFGDTMANFHLSAYAGEYAEYDGTIKATFLVRRRHPVKHGLSNSLHFCRESLEYLGTVGQS